ncbi:MAG: diguanylate cyclase [Bdellovibrionales bacterium]|nr:diguanylate cyclase [Bdellovibrionales bacterium]
MTILSKTETKGKRILVVDDDKQSLDVVTEFVSKEGLAVTSAADVEAALHRVRAWKPHVVLLDMNLPGATGIELVGRIRQLSPDEYTAIVLISGEIEEDFVLKGIDAGADDYLGKPFRSVELLSRIRAMLHLKELQDSLRRSHHRIEELTSTDELTGLFNMKAMYRDAENEVLRCKRFRKPISGILVNLDQFTTVNENADFLFGNVVLKEVGAIIKRAVRNMDYAARVGADEFFILLPETDLAGAEYVANRIRESIQTAEFKADRYSAKITACLGVAGFSLEHTGTGMGELYRNCNESLRSAKVGGTNRTEIYSFV